jgi:hypothetical protein
MIADIQELRAALARIAWFHEQAAHFSNTETKPANDRAAAAGSLAEIDRMQLELREFFQSPPRRDMPQSLEFRERGRPSGRHRLNATTLQTFPASAGSRAWRIHCLTSERRLVCQIEFPFPRGAFRPPSTH